MSSVRFLVGSDLRRRWRSLIVLALLVALIGSVVLTALAGARRTQSAYPRLLDAILASTVDIEVGREYFDAIGGLPEVEVVGPASFMFVTPTGFEGDDLVSIAPTDGRFTTELDRPLLIDGRRPRLDHADEVMLNTEAANRMGAEPGDVLTLVSLTPDQLERLIFAGEDPGRPAGPEIEVTVVGVGRTQEELASGTPILLLMPAFYDAHRGDIGHFDDILQVRLTRGEEDLEAFRVGMRRVVPASEGASVDTGAETSAKVRDAAEVQAISLLIFAVAAALAGFVAIGQALARQAPLWAGDQMKLLALGLRRRQRFAAMFMPAVLIAVAGAGVAVGLAVVASPMMPMGFARPVEPDPGVAADWFVLGLGFVAVAGLVAGCAALSTWRMSASVADVPSAAGGTRLAGQLGRLRVPVPFQTGVRMALEPGRGPTAVPVRWALLGAVAGTAGVVAALTFGAALAWVVTEPAAFGQTWDASVVGPFERGELRGAVAALAEGDDVEAVAALSVLPIQLEGSALRSYGLEAFESGDFTIILDGRMPQGIDEVLVGAQTLDRLDRRVGDTVDVTGLEGGRPREVTIVGRGVFPEFIHPAVPDSESAYNDFALFTEAGNESFAAEAGGEYFSMALVRFTPGTDVTAATARLEEGGAETQVLDRPSSLDNLARVDAFPGIIAAFLVVVAASAAAHALVTSVRRRARDLAVLKTLGFVGSQVRATVASQASTFAAVGAVLGIPSGLVVGRTAWTLVARRLGIDDRTPIPWLPIILILPGALLAANMLAVLPGRRAASTPSAVLLQSK